VGCKCVFLCVCVCVRVCAGGMCVGAPQENQSKSFLSSASKGKAEEK